MATYEPPTYDIYIYTYIHLSLSLYVYIYICICMYVCVYIYIHMYVYICDLLYIYIYMHIYTHTIIYIYTHIHTYIHITSKCDLWAPNLWAPPLASASPLPQRPRVSLSLYLSLYIYTYYYGIFVTTWGERRPGWHGTLASQAELWLTWNMIYYHIANILYYNIIWCNLLYISINQYDITLSTIT